MQYSPLNNIPISLGQRTPDVLKNSHRIQRDDFRGDSSFRQDTSTISQRRYIPTSSYADRSSFIEPEPSQNYSRSGLRDSRSSFQDPYSQQQKTYQTRRSEEGFSSSFSRSYQPMVSTQPVSSYISNTYEAYVSRPEGLIQLVLNSYIINGGILLLTSIGFLLLSLSIFCFITQGWNFSLDTWQFLRALLFLSAILISKALMLKYYDTFVNWNDVVRDLFTSGPLFQITLFFSVFAIVAYTYDIFTFFIQAKSVEEISHVLVICIVNSIISVVRSLSNKEYLLASTSFETNWSYFSEYHPMNLFTIAVKHVGQSLKVILISSMLSYSGLISLIFEETLSMLSYEYLQFPGLGKALVRGLIYFAGLWGANFILEVQINVMKRIWIRVLDRIGNTRYSMKSLYYFNDRSESDDALVGHSLRFIDTKIRYECRNSLLRRQNQGDPESKTIWHVLIENTLEKLDRISSQLQTLKASRLVMSGSFGPKGHNENMLMALQYFFTSPPDVKDVRHLYHDMCVGAHQFKVVNRIFREMKILNLDVALRNFNINLQTYYQGLYNVNSILWQIKNINQSPYIDSLLADISHFEEVTKEGLLMLNKFVALQ